MFQWIFDLLTVARVQTLVAFCLLVRRDRWLLRLLGSDAAEADRARFGIHAFIGANGSGKTNVMVRQAMRALNRGRTVISTVPLFADKAEGILHPNYVPFTSWEQLRDARNCHILMDEMTGVANARENAPLPALVQLILNQLRKRKIVVLWSSPSWEDAQVQIRRLTRAVTVCVGSWPDKKAWRAAAAAATAEFDDAWIPNRLFNARTYQKPGNSSDFKQDGVPHVAEWYWGPGSASFNTYDTNAETTRFGQANDYGQCVVCEGTRRRDECSCDDYVQKKAARAPKREPKPARHTHPVEFGSPVRQ